ncbi:MAG: FAD:protein FMN transferase, partial [Ferruginibacter sp.]|nr:FAD:protein FMN transferase [Cytophagales bacterium]
MGDIREIYQYLFKPQEPTFFFARYITYLLESAVSLGLVRASVATSGDEQPLELDGKRHSPILDPRTGLDLTDRSRVAVVAPDGVTADWLPTAVSGLGPEQGLRLVEKTPGAAVVFVRMTGEQAVEWE